ncbi:peptidoglycan DD-metalloendopeptidase family protein [Rathayibacter toxicus]|uniref:peptidoglycan DD-metalloendopeptidase family protein n=1 Tax=Rathayibacter toxicus TaxID=145458 RepID=UPI0005B2513F|nr:peptidoglycan DD-metalloendopeptidase family protein [Rathayibacter toxicus]AJM78230.1 hypothetical protein TI83_10455 [Rathayibacter toxicus]ALS57478.1 hypothetical protein APU90_06610 [Rathayibacter toxicus]PPG20853.1 cell wall-binding protein [Rathayibacter toxicus]PPG45956.1 cell wall-binding protein [Rathayibacter toxicus]PPH62534.1 cell wall-binding protein [Rathayibacter toxicus]
MLDIPQRPGFTRFFGVPRRRRLRGTIVGSVMLALIVGVAVASPARAADYPTWEDVQAAKGNTAAVTAQVEKITALIGDLQKQVAAAQQLAQQRGAEHFAAQQAFDLASDRAADLDSKARAGAAAAEAASQQAGLLAAQLYRSTGTDISLTIFLEGQNDGSDQLLSRIGSMTKLVERSNAIYEQATAARNTASSLADQAEIARAERERRRIDAEAKLAEATAAQEASESALAHQRQQGIVLEQQLAALRDTESKTVANYQAGVAAREAERQRKLAEEASARAGGGGSTALSGSGWARPAAGVITGTFGARDSIATIGGTTNSFHRGTDIAGGCGTPIFAAYSGTVQYAGPNGTYGNFILIDHGQGISTGYAHIVNGGIYVRVGQHVDAGEHIADAGDTGASTACHLHFETRVNGSAVNAQPFMAARGVTLG